MDLAKATARRDENILSSVIWWVLYYRFYSLLTTTDNTVWDCPNEWQSLPRRCNIWYRSLPCCHDDVIKWKHFPRNWPFLRGIHRWPVNSPHKGQWRRALMFSLICTRINGWVNNGEAGDLRRHRDHYDVIMYGQIASNIHVSEIYRFSCNCVWSIFM